MKRISRTPVWAIPIAFAILLAGVGLVTFRSLEAALVRDLETSLATLRDASATAIEIWSEDRRSEIEVLTQSPALRAAALELVRLDRESGGRMDVIAESTARAEFVARALAGRGRLGFHNFGLIGTDYRFIVNTDSDRVGVVASGLIELLHSVFEGETVLAGPLGQHGARMALLSGIRDDEGRVVAAFGYSFDSTRDFARMLAIARRGETGETYVFDRRGRLLSPSRFEEALRAAGVLGEGESSVVALQERDPGGNLLEGFEADPMVETRPLTRAGERAIEGAGVDTEGYADYRGVPVVGAWTRLPGLDLGLVSKLDRAEAYAPLLAARRTSIVVQAMLAIASLGLLGYSVIAQRLRKNAADARQLGRYTIESKIGSGGMGTVYLARHALLRRPTAIKVLDSGRADKEAIARFEREVQTTSALLHPNTIEIYDYGYTSDDTFYYAMEYLDGSTLSEILRAEGALPEARVVFILAQICGSIAEAHDAGLIHRDIKPANIMLCARGNIYDFAKVLDFGLVREVQQSSDAALTDTSALTGTPLYMPPEAIRTPDEVDARADVYQLGVLAYQLLSGTPPFEGDTAMDIMLKHVHDVPRPLSAAAGQPISRDLEALVMRCLEKERGDRPANAGELGQLLLGCRVSGTWAQSTARAWWGAWDGGRAEVGGSSADDSNSLPSGLELADRS